MKDKFLAKCKHCKRYNGGNCTISDFEDRSCAFVYEHLMSEGIGDCDVFEKEKDKRYIVGISLWVYAVDKEEANKFAQERCLELNNKHDCDAVAEVAV